MKMLFNKQTLLTCSAIIIVCVFSFSLATKEKEKNLQNKAQAVENTNNKEINTNTNANTKVTYDYIIKVHEGKIAVFLVGNNIPEMIFDVYVHHLPEYDRQQLQNGILIKDYPALVAAIEDYIS